MSDIRRSSGKTFVLGAGFSVRGGFPAVRSLKKRVLDYIRSEAHPLWSVFLERGNGGFERGQFFEGLYRADQEGTLGFEELLISLTDQLRSSSDRFDPRFITLKVLRLGCAKFFWSIHNNLKTVPDCYAAFSKWLMGNVPGHISNAVITFNWDLLAERILGTGWSYSAQEPTKIPLLKPHGSINWSRYLAENLRAEYQGWKPIRAGSLLSFDGWNPLVDPDRDDIHPDLRYMLFPGDRELPSPDPGLEPIWEDAATVISERPSVIFIGYSLPRYDSYSLNFLKKWLAGKEIEVFNPSEEDLGRFSDEFGQRAQKNALTFESCPYGRVPTDY